MSICGEGLAGWREGVARSDCGVCKRRAWGRCEICVMEGEGGGQTSAAY